MGMDSKVFLAMLAAGNFLVLILLAAYQKKYTDIRVLIFTSVNALLVIPAALRIFKVKNRSSLHNLLAVFFILMMSAFVIRILDSLRLGVSLAIFGPTFGEIVTIVFLFVYLLLGGVGITLLAKEKTDANLFHLAHYDESTGTFNRDGFSEISEVNGYVAGDSVIMNTVVRLREVVGGAGFVGRLNEYEFMLRPSPRFREKKGPWRNGNLGRMKL